VIAHRTVCPTLRVVKKLDIRYGSQAVVHHAITRRAASGRKADAHEASSNQANAATSSGISPVSDHSHTKSANSFTEKICELVLSADVAHSLKFGHETDDYVVGSDTLSLGRCG
jgi:hypothetical protein